MRIGPLICRLRSTQNNVHIFSAKTSCRCRPNQACRQTHIGGAPTGAVPKIEIKAVHERDVEGILKKYGQYGEFAQNRAQCYVCGKTVNKDNMGSLKRSGNGVELACNEPPCIAASLKGTVSGYTDG